MRARKAPPTNKKTVQRRGCDDGAGPSRLGVREVEHRQEARPILVAALEPSEANPQATQESE
jgi:hypothetical protein